MASIQETTDQEYQDHIMALVEEHRRAKCFQTGERPYDVGGEPRYSSFEEWWASFNQPRRARNGK